MTVKVMGHASAIDIKLITLSSHHIHMVHIIFDNEHNRY